MQPDWTDPAWRAEVDAWVGTRLEELGLGITGPVEQPHIRPWATALRIPTDGGDVWFKANMRDAPVDQRLAHRLVGVVERGVLAHHRDAHLALGRADSIDNGLPARQIERIVRRQIEVP